MNTPTKHQTPLYWPFKVPDRAEYLRHQKDAQRALKALLDKIPPSPL